MRQLVTSGNSELVCDALDQWLLKTSAKSIYRDSAEIETGGGHISEQAKRGGAELEKRIIIISAKLSAISASPRFVSEKNSDKWSTPLSLQTIAAFSPLPGEVDLRPCIAKHPQVRWVFPRVDGDHLSFHGGENLSPGSFGILEPNITSPEIPLSEIDVFLCPGLAFSPSGHRLGRGRGYYDRLLAQIRPDALKIGICFPEQIVPDTFPEPHDIPMDMVIS